MNLKHLTDQQLAIDVKNICQKERALLTHVLYHLKEIEFRKLYSSFGYSSLFDYACIELKYSSDQAYRRIQAMRLLKDIPEVAAKIDSGELSLSNITQAQKYFKDTKILTKENMNKSEKINILKKLMNKSVRDGQKELLKLIPEKPLPIDTKKQVTPTQTYVGFSMSEDLEKKLEDIKSLLGSKAYDLNMADLINQMADLAKEKLEEKMFGKKLAAQIDVPSSSLSKKNENKKGNRNKIKNASENKIDKENESSTNAEKKSKYEGSANKDKEIKPSTLIVQTRGLEKTISNSCPGGNCLSVNNQQTNPQFIKNGPIQTVFQKKDQSELIT